MNYTSIVTIRVREDGCRVVTRNYEPTGSPVSGRQIMHYKKNSEVRTGNQFDNPLR